MQKQTIHRQKGFSLIEALVAFLILSVGMLGIASLQLISMKAGQTAALRTVAVVKAEEIMERIRNNPMQVSLYDEVGTGTDKGCNDYSGTVNACTQEDMVADDVYFWLKSLTESLPNTAATGVIDVADPVVGGMPLAVVTVTIKWEERDSESQAKVDMTYSTTSQVCNTTAC